MEKVYLTMKNAGVFNVVMGILLAVPVLLCLRAVLRICTLSRAGDPGDSPEIVKER